MGWLESMEGSRAAAIRKVVGVITEGQSWDLERFQGEGIVALSDDGELETYAYQVAGSVGEFWTEIGVICDPGFSRYSSEELRVLGANYGKGLQLVNILTCDSWIVFSFDFHLECFSRLDANPRLAVFDEFFLGFAIHLDSDFKGPAEGLQHGHRVAELQTIH